MGVVGNLIVKVTADTAGLKEGVSSTKKELSGLESTVSNIGKTLAAAFTVDAVIGYGQAAVAAFASQEQAIAAVEAKLISTEGAAGKTLDGLIEDAAALQESSLFGDEDILRGVTQQLLTFTNVVGSEFDTAQQVILDLAATLGGADASPSSLQSAAIMVGKALNDPAAGLTSLQRVGITFTKKQKDVIKELLLTNKTAAAQNVILKEMQKQFGGTAKAVAATTTGEFKQFRNEVGDLNEDVGALVAAVGLELLPTFQDAAADMATLVGAINNVSGALGGDSFGFIGKVIKATWNVTKWLSGIELVWKGLGLLSGGADTAASSVDSFSTKVSVFTEGGALPTFNDTIGETKEIFEDMNSPLQRVIGKLKDYKKPAEDAGIATKDAKEELLNIQEAARSMITIFGGDKESVVQVWEDTTDILEEELNPLLFKAEGATRDFGVEWGLLGENLRTTPVPEIDVSNLSTALTDIKDRISGDGPDSLTSALVSDLGGAITSTFGLGGIFPGAIGGLIDGAIQDLINAILTDLINGAIMGAVDSLLGEGGLEEAFGSVSDFVVGAFGEGGAAFGVMGIFFGLFYTFADEMEEFFERNEPSTEERLTDASQAIVDAIANGVTDPAQLLDIGLKAIGAKDFLNLRDSIGVEGIVDFLMNFIAQFLGGGDGDGLTGRASVLPIGITPSLPVAPRASIPSLGGGTGQGATLRIVDSNLDLVMVGVLEGGS